MRMLSLLLSILMGTTATQATYPTPGPGRQVHSCNAPTMTYRWTPTSGCSTSTPCATDQVSGNNASQTTSGDLPTYSATGGPNSTPSLTFNGTSDFLVLATPIPSGLTTFTMYAIFKTATSATSANYDLFGGSNNSAEFGVDTSNQAFLNAEDVAGAAGTRVFAPSTWYTEVVTYNNGTPLVSFYAVSGSGLSSDGTTAVALSFTSTTPNLGGNTTNSDYFDGSIAEWGYLNSVNTSGIAAWSSCHYGV